MSDLSVSERRIRPIQDAVVAKNWKQALQICDKWHKKGEKSDRFLALKASVLINQPDKTSIDKGKQEVLQLCHRKDAVTDIEALYQLQHSLKRLSLEIEEGPALWDRASSAVPNDKSLIISWLNNALADSNWLMAQKAAMKLRKAFPKERQYDFWNILLCYLAHNDTSLQEKDRTLFGTLAYRLISKAAEAAPTDTSEVLTSGKAIATTEELALLLHIYLATSHTQEAIDLLQSASLGLSSKVAEQDVNMVFSLLLKGLEQLPPSATVLDICQKLILEANLPVKDPYEDDRIWKIVVKVGISTDESQLEKCFALVESVLGKHASCRAVHLAKLDLLQHAIRNDPGQKRRLAEACSCYFEQFKAKPFCFDDLHTSLQCIEHGEVQKLISKATYEGAPSTERLFALKVEYSIVLNGAELQMEETFTFAAKAVRLSQSLPEIGNERPEAILLASLALLRLACRVNSTDLVLQACLMLEASYSRYGEYYPLAVRLMQTYRNVGLTSLAAERFVSLSIKNMQWETVGHLLLTRISTFHPLTAGEGENSLNPLYALDVGLDMLDSMEASLSKAIQKGLGFGSYSNVLDTIQLKQSVQQSLNRLIFLIEERKIQNLVNVPVTSVFESRPGVLIDNRDFSFLKDYGVDDKICNDCFACGALPAQIWLEAAIFGDHLQQYLRFETIGHTTLASDAFEALSKSAESLKYQQHLLSTELTVAESRNLECQKLILEVFLAMRSPNLKQFDLDSAIDKIIASLATPTTPDTDSVNEIRVPGWQYFHVTLSELTILQIVSLLVEHLSRKSKTAKGKAVTASKEKIAELKTTVWKAEETIRSDTKSLKTGINVSGVLGQLVDAVSGRLETGSLSQSPGYNALSEACSGLYDEVFVEEYCGKLRDSWSGALDGILAINIKGPK